jgi:phage protein D
MADDLYYRVSVSAAGAKYDLSQDLGSLTLEERESEPAKLTIQLNDPFKVFGYALQDGMEVEAELGTNSDHSLVFRGRICHVDAAFPEGGVPTLSVFAYDKLIAMGLRWRNRVFKDKKLSDIVRAVATPYFTDVTITVSGDPSFGSEGIRQTDETDLAFLLRLADEAGCELYVVPTDSGERFEFVAQKTIMEAEPDVTLFHGRCDVEHRLLSFTPSSDVSRIEVPAVMSGVDFEKGEATSVGTMTVEDAPLEDDEFVDESLTGFRKRYPDKAGKIEALIAVAPAVQTALLKELGETVRRVFLTFTTEADLAERLKNRFNTRRLGMQASGSTLGNHHLRAQVAAAILDVGGRFSGKWFLNQVTHSMTRSGFRTDFECRR